jgi:hypothetical protein
MVFSKYKKYGEGIGKPYDTDASTRVSRGCHRRQFHRRREAMRRQGASGRRSLPRRRLTNHQANGAMDLLTSAQHGAFSAVCWISAAACPKNSTGCPKIALAQQLIASRMDTHLQP